MVITQISRKKLWGHRACLGDIVQNIAKMGVLMQKTLHTPNSVSFSTWNSMQQPTDRTITKITEPRLSAHP